MKKILLFVAVSFLSFQVFAQRKAYKNTIEQNTISGYEMFIKEHPDSKYTAEIRLKLEDLEIEEAKRNHTIQDYNSFLEKYPNSKYKSEAEKQIEALFFDEAKEGHTIQSYDVFLKRYPDSEFKSEAEKQIEALHFGKATEKHTIQGYSIFLEMYPESRYESNAKDKIETIYFSEAKEKHTVKVYNDFLELYPYSRYKSEVKEQIELLDFDEAKKTNTTQAYDGFLKKYPDTKYLSEIEAAKFIIISKKEIPRIERLDSISQVADIVIIVSSNLKNKTSLSASQIMDKISVRSFENSFIVIYLENTIQLMNLYIYNLGGGLPGDKAKKQKTKEQFYSSHEKILDYLEFFSKALKENRKHEAKIAAILTILTYKEGIVLGLAKKNNLPEVIRYLESFLPNALEKHFSKYDMKKD